MAVSKKSVGVGKPSASRASRMVTAPVPKRTLCVDVGGTHVKAAIVTPDGAMQSDHARLATPHPCPPETLVEMIETLAKPLGGYDRVSIGFPGAVRRGIILTAPNLRDPERDGAEWHAVDLAGAVQHRLNRPARLANDAEIQGLGAITGVGLETVITLGTGMGFAIFSDGIAAPHLELGQHNAHKTKSYDQYVGHATLERIGPKKWRKHVDKVIAQIRILVNFDTLYIGGGNARLIGTAPAPDIKPIANETGITGGVRLWDGIGHSE